MSNEKVMLTYFKGTLLELTEEQQLRIRTCAIAMSKLAEQLCKEEDECFLAKTLFCLTLAAEASDD